MLSFGLLARGEYVPPPFDGGMFANGGFENGLDGWLQYNTWTAGTDNAVNPATGTNQVLYQNFTLEDGVSYEISAINVSGDAIINYFVNDANSGVAIGTPHIFVGNGGAVSIGIFITNVGTVQSVVDSMKLERV